jgi:hypothetical protein
MPIIEEATSYSSVIDDQLKLVVLNSSRTLVNRWALGLPLLPARMRNASSRMASKGGPLINVRGKNVFVVQPFTAMIGKAAPISCAGFFSLSAR